MYEHVDGYLRERHDRLVFNSPLVDLASSEDGYLVLHTPQQLTNVRIDPPASPSAIAHVRFTEPRAVASRGGRTMAVGKDALYLLGFEAGGEPRIDRAWPGGGHTMGLSEEGAWMANNDYVTRFGGPTWELLRPLSHGARAAWPIDTLVVTEDDRLALAAGRESDARGISRRSDAWNAAGLATFSRTKDGLELRSAEDRPGDLVRLIEAQLPATDDRTKEPRSVVLGHDRRAVWAFPVLNGDTGQPHTVGASYPVVPPGTWPKVTDIAIWGNRLFVAEREAVHVLDLSAAPAPATLALTLDIPNASRMWAGDGLLTIQFAFGMGYYQIPDEGPPERIEFELPPDDSWDGPGYYTNVTTRDGLLIGSTTRLLDIIDMSDPVRPVHLAQRRLSMVTTGVPRTPRVEAVMALEDRLLALSAGTILEFYDLRQPRSPRRFATMDMPEIITSVTVADGHVYAAVVDHGVFRFDLRLPEQPNDAGWLRMRDLGENASIVVQGNRVFVGGGEAPGPRMLDITGGWGFVVAEVDTAPATAIPTAIPSPPTVPSPAPPPTGTTTVATATPRSPSATPSRRTGRHVLHLPWLLREGAAD